MTARIREGLDLESAKTTARLAKALSHPLRVQIIWCLAQKPGGAASVAGLLGNSLSNVSYHLNEVLDRQYHLVKRTKVRETRGENEKVYELDSTAIPPKITELATRLTQERVLRP